MANADRLHYANMVEERSRELSLVKTKLDEAQMQFLKIGTNDEDEVR